MFQLDSTPGRTVIIGEQEWLFFSGYAYLGMQQLPAIQKAYAESIRKYGWLFPSARISNTQLRIFQQAEEQLTLLTGMEQTVLFGNGFMAGQAALSSIPHDAITACAPGSHPAIAKVPPARGSFDQWAMHMVEQVNSSSRNHYLLADAVNPLTAEVHDFTFLSAIRQPVVVIIDDSHGIGLLGNEGQGISSMLPRHDHIEYIITYSLSKAWSLPGGAVSCSRASRAEKLMQTPWYSATTPPSPAVLELWMQHRVLFLQQLHQLRHRIAFLKQLLRDQTKVISHSQLPVFRLPERMDEKYFAANGIIISSFAYPDANGPKLNRAVLSALHTEADLLKLAGAIAK